jgi:FAD/FMN-containing dehydrogenase
MSNVGAGLLEKILATADRKEDGKRACPGTVPRLPMDGELEIWNAAVPLRPAAVRRCGDAGQVSTAVGRARADGLPLSVLSGGHDWADRAVREGGLVIDLRGMRDVEISGDVATVGGGATAAGLIAAAAATGQSAATGTVGELLRRGDQMFARDGRHYAIRTRNLAGLTAEAVTVILTAGAARTSPLSAINLHHFHGAATRVAPTATAFGTRGEHFMAEIIASWLPANDDRTGHRQWADTTADHLGPYALPGGYANLLTTDHPEQLAHAYGPNAARLTALKDTYDPDHVFTAIPLPPRRRARLGFQSCEVVAEAVRGMGVAPGRGDHGEPAPTSISAAPSRTAGSRAEGAPRQRSGGAEDVDQ